MKPDGNSKGLAFVKFDNKNEYDKLLENNGYSFLIFKKYLKELSTWEDG